MAALYVMIPVAMVIVGIAIWLFFWAVNSGQFDDLDSPAHSILFDDTEPFTEPEHRENNGKPDA